MDNSERMKLWDSAALAALMGILARSESSYEKAASWAYDYADNLLAERERRLRGVAQSGQAK